MTDRNERILVIYTGGTIGMSKSDDGLIVSTEGQQVINDFLTLRAKNLNYEINFHVAERLIDSGEASPKDWVNIAKIIEQKINDNVGVIVIHGTDTMTYAGCMLTILLANLNVPIVITGAQRPYFYDNSDAFSNLSDAVSVIEHLKGHEVAVVFGGKVLYGDSVTKTSSIRDEAFESLNIPAVGVITNGVFKRNQQPANIEKIKKLDIHSNASPRIDVVTISPVINNVFLDLLAANPPDGLVIEVFGLGGTPTTISNIIEILEAMIKNGTTVIAITECGHGGLSLGKYPSGTALLNAGVIDGKAMTRSAAICKLWCALADGSTSKTESLVKLNE